MPRKLKIYLDTSVPNAYFDDKNLNRQEITIDFWQKLNEYQVFISDLVLTEIKATKNDKLKNKLVKLIENFECLSTKEDEIKALSEEYIFRGIIPVKHINDAFHIAVTTVSSLDILVSWNFEHIVKLKTKREVNAINILLGYNQIEIVEPSML